jgi:hypothetical protein
VNQARLYDILRPGSAGAPGVSYSARYTIRCGQPASPLCWLIPYEPLQAGHGGAFADAFHFGSVFFIAEYWLRLACAPGAPGADDRAPRRARLCWTCSIGGVFDFLGALPGILNLVLDTNDAMLFGLI